MVGLRRKYAGKEFMLLMPKNNQIFQIELLETKQTKKETRVQVVTKSFAFRRQCFESVIGLSDK